MRRTIFRITLSLFLCAAVCAFSAETGSDGVSVDTALGELGASLSFDPLSRLAVLSVGAHRLAFLCPDQVPLSGKTLGLWDGEEVLRLSAPQVVSGELRFPRNFLDEVSAALGRSLEKEKSSFRVAAILIDPGHGGKDPGAVATHTIDGKKVSLQEKDIALEVALNYYDLLKKAYPEKKILLSRKGDTYPTLEQRVALANSVPLKDNEAIIFVSIHLNASFNKTARGFEVWYLSPEYRRTVVDRKQYADSSDVLPILNAMLEEEFTTESIVIAKSLLSRLEKAASGRSPARGVKAEEWFVVRNARMPSVLAELGFITNPEDARLLSSPLYLRELSEALYSGTVDFIASFESSGGFTVVK